MKDIKINVNFECEKVNNTYVYNLVNFSIDYDNKLKDLFRVSTAYIYQNINKGVFTTFTFRNNKCYSYSFRIGNTYSTNSIKILNEDLELIQNVYNKIKQKSLLT